MTAGARETGTEVRGWLWAIVWRHLPVAPPPDDTRATPLLVEGHAHIISADPTGRDLYELAERAVLGENARPGLEFTLVRVERGCELKGSAVVVEARH